MHIPKHSGKNTGMRWTLGIIRDLQRSSGCFFDEKYPKNEFGNGFEAPILKFFEFWADFMNLEPPFLVEISPILLNILAADHFRLFKSVLK